MNSTLGIIAYNNASILISGPQSHRPIAALNFVGRYRLVDIPISNMANSGMNNMDVYTNQDPKVLFDHIGSARHYNINNKHGHVGIIPVFNENGERPEFVSDMESYYRNLAEIKRDSNKYIVIAPVNYVYKVNFQDLVNMYKDSDADVLILSKHVEDPEGKLPNAEFLEADGKRVKAIKRNITLEKEFDMSLATYIMSKAKFIEIINASHEYSKQFWLTDILNLMIERDNLHVEKVAYSGPVFPILDQKSYFESNMAMLDPKNMAFFNDPNWPIYTRTNDSSPAIYVGDGSSSDALVSNGCVIGGSITHSILGRNVIIGNGAIIDNCLIMPGAEVGEGVMLTNAIMDKDSKVIHAKEIAGYLHDPIYIDRREVR